MDVFAAALGDSRKIGAEVGAGVKLAPSQDIAGTEGLGRISFDGTVVILDDCGSGDGAKLAPSQDISGTLEEATGAKRRASQSPHPGGAKRKRNPIDSTEPTAPILAEADLSCSDPPPEEPHNEDDGDDFAKTPPPMEFSSEEEMFERGPHRELERVPERSAGDEPSERGDEQKERPPYR